MTAVREDLLGLESLLKQFDLWEEVTPSQDALASTQPFAIDTLRFNQWLQFIFFPRVHALLDAGQSLPGRCGLAPMMEEFVRLEAGLSPEQGTRLIRQVRLIDDHFASGEI